MSRHCFSCRLFLSRFGPVGNRSGTFSEVQRRSRHSPCSVSLGRRVEEWTAAGTTFLSLIPTNVWGEHLRYCGCNLRRRGSKNGSWGCHHELSRRVVSCPEFTIQRKSHCGMTARRHNRVALLWGSRRLLYKPQIIGISYMSRNHTVDKFKLPARFPDWPSMSLGPYDY